MDRMKAQALRWGTHLVETDAEQIELGERPYRIRTSEGDIIQTQTLIIATGASANRLQVPHEEDFWSRGISACAICDGATPQFRREQLAVVGGGDSACEEAVYLTKYGSQVHLIVRSDRLRASAAMADRVLANPAITVHWNQDVIDVTGGPLASGDQWLSAVMLRDRVTGTTQSLSVRGLFYAIGHTPNTSLLRGQISLDERGYLQTQPGRPETALDGVFAAGDVADAEWRQGITAAASGCQAALAAERWLSHKGLAIKMRREEVDPAPAGDPVRTVESDAGNYNPSALWQKGAYALRKLYHDSNNPLLVVYTSPSCGPCHVLKPQLKRVLQELGGQAQGVEIDIEADPEIAQQAGVSGTPTVQLFFRKAMKQQWRGVKQRSEFRRAIEGLLDQS